MSRHELHRVRSFERIGRYALRVEFADGSTHPMHTRPGRRAL